ncbi:hypothetical protein CRM22_011256 [Opisthorchis felineus]|uniref:U2A'/phosphoprotein 32 family A C-terminal domain-containing protein n=1 Tax=Opisthorchis felineus TaxID=147828 RepID=A0A4S2JVT6_OPIFE|nr:hypothetical protein CRM22_011256 [Opisthorchis felineus]
MSVTTDAVDNSSRSALVQVTELSENPVNPKPKRLVSKKEVFDEYINESALKVVCRKDDLSAVTALDIKIDVEKVSCGNFGALLPNLRQLRLSNSYVPAIRELGSEFSKIEVLWMPRCCVKCLDGVAGMKNLSELYLAFNEIVDLSPCLSLVLLEILDLEGNLVGSRENLTYLKTCSRLSTLTLEGNPIIGSCGGVKTYRELVRKTLPQVRVLDDAPVEDPATNKVSYDVTDFDNQWKYINDVLREVGLISDGQMKSAEKDGEQCKSIQPSAPSVTAPNPAIYPGRPGSGIRPSSAQKHLRSLKGGRTVSPNLHPAPSGSLRPASSASQITETEVPSENDETTSELTTGQVVCGGISGALRTRRGSLRATDARPADMQNSVTKPEQSSPPRNRKKGVMKKKETSGEEFEKSRDCGKLKATREAVRKQRAEISDPASLAILEEEDALEAECESVLNELAAWRKQNLKPQVFHTRKNGIQIAKIRPNNTENDAVLMSTDSESTLDDRSGASQTSAQSRKISSPESSQYSIPPCEQVDEKAQDRWMCDEGVAKLNGDNATPGLLPSSRLSSLSSNICRPFNQAKKGVSSFPVRTPLAHSGLNMPVETEEPLPGQNPSLQPQTILSRRPPVRPPFHQMIQTLANNGIGRISKTHEQPVAGALKAMPSLNSYRPRLGLSTPSDGRSGVHVAGDDGKSRANLNSTTGFTNPVTKFGSKPSAVRSDSTTTRLATRLPNRTSSTLPSRPSVQRDSF